MRNEKITALLCAALICIPMLTGCQLAQADMGAEAGSDRFAGNDMLAGVLVTTEYLDLFDMESYLNDNISIVGDGVISIDGDMQNYQGRIYATLETRTSINDETGESVQHEEYVFKGINGIAYFIYNISNATESYIATSSNEGISDGNLYISVDDDGELRTLEGTVYVTNSNMTRYYINPVYQSADGSIYAISGSGISASGEYGEGLMMSQTVSDTYSVTENGETKVYGTSATISVSVIYEPEKIAVLQMDAESSVVSRTEFMPGTLPDTVAPEPGAEYIIVETHKRNHEGENIIAREIYSRDNTSLATFFARPDGICVKRSTEIVW